MNVVYVHLPLNNVGHNHCYMYMYIVFFLLRGERKFIGGGQSQIKCFIEEHEAKLDFPRNGERGFIHVPLGEIDVLEISLHLTQHAKTGNHTYCSLQFV